MAKVVAVLSTAGLVIVLIAVIIYFSFFGPRARGRMLDAPGVVMQVRRLNDLATVKYSIEKVVGMTEEKSPVGAESILLLVRGTVVAGIPLGELSEGDVSFGGNGSAQIRLGQPNIQDAYLDEKYTKVWDRGVTWWTPWVTPDLNLEHKARLQAVDDVRKEALEMGILGEARRNAELDIGNVLRALGVPQVTFSYGT